MDVRRVTERYFMRMVGLRCGDQSEWDKTRKTDMGREEEAIDIILKLRTLLNDIHAECGNYYGLSATSNHVMHQIIRTAGDKSREGLALVNDDDGFSKW